MTTADPLAHPPLATRVAATALWLAFAGGAAVAAVLDALAHRSIWDPVFVAFASFASIGWLLAYRRPNNALGWLFLAIGILTALGVTTDALVHLAVRRGWPCQGIVLFAAWVQLWFWYPLIVMATGFTVLLFPDGLRSRRWRPLAAILALGATAATVTSALAPTVQFGGTQVPNPTGINVGVKDIENTLAFELSGVVLLVALLTSIASLGLRYRSSRGVERAQLKWFFLGASAVGVTLALSLLWPAFNDSTANNIMFAGSLALLPLSCGLAVLRYRLYDIDRVVSRTLSYAVVTGLVAGVYVGVIALVETVLGASSSVSVAASTLAAAVAFQPLRRRTQQVVDRRFDREAYDARRTVAAFSARLRDEVDVGTVRADLLQTVTAAVAPAQVFVWIAS